MSYFNFKWMAPALAAFLAIPAFAQQGRTPGPSQVPEGARQGQIGSQPVQRSEIVVVPLFKDPAVRRSLELTPLQLSELNKLNEQLARTYRQGVGDIGTTAVGRDRADRIELLRQNYVRTFFREAETIMQPRQITRYRQLSLQEQGFQAFADPAVQKRMNLTQTQIDNLRSLGDMFRQETRQLAATASSTDRPKLMEQYRVLHRKYWDQVNEVLQPNQQKLWSEMTGEPFDFPPDFATPRALPQRQERRNR